MNIWAVLQSPQRLRRIVHNNSGLRRLGRVISCATLLPRSVGECNHDPTSNERHYHFWTNRRNRGVAEEIPKPCPQTVPDDERNHRVHKKWTKRDMQNTCSSRGERCEIGMPVREKYGSRPVCGELPLRLIERLLKSYSGKNPAPTM